MSGILNEIPDRRGPCVEVWLFFLAAALRHRASVVILRHGKF